VTTHLLASKTINLVELQIMLLLWCYYTKYFTSASRSGNFAIILQVCLVHICALMPLFYVKILLMH
jgi:hypothetical protein